MPVFRLLIDPPAPGAWNMAVDEALLESATAGGSGALRLYQWNPATLSLGYFQAAADRESHAASRECPLVRRASGGGAILHDRELTYSIVLPQPAANALSATALYNSIHESLVAALVELGIPAVLHCPSAHQVSGPRQTAAEPFLCFQRRTRGDVLCQGAKIVGSAQRRRRGAVLQHGSILLARSPQAPELPGIEDLAGRRLPRESGEALPVAVLIAAWLPHLAARLPARLVPSALTPVIKSRVDSLAAERFAAPAFTRQR